MHPSLVLLALLLLLFGLHRLLRLGLSCLGLLGLDGGQALALLNEECTKNALAGGLHGQTPAIRTRNTALVILHAATLASSARRDADQSGTSVTAYGNLAGLQDVLEGQLAARSLNDLHLVGSGVVRVVASVGKSLHHGPEKQVYGLGVI